MHSYQIYFLVLPMTKFWGVLRVGVGLQWGPPPLPTQKVEELRGEKEVIKVVLPYTITFMSSFLKGIFAISVFFWSAPYNFIIMLLYALFPFK